MPAGADPARSTRSATAPDRGRRGAAVTLNVARLLLAAAAGTILVGLYTTYRIWDQGLRDDSRPADAIVVLGAAQYNGTPSPLFRARLDHAIALYHDGIAPILVVTGGKGREGDITTEAEAAMAYAVAHDVPASAILVEDRGRTTLESLRTVGSMLRERQLASAVFVSDRSHMLRVLRMARDQGIIAYGSPTTTSPTESSLSEQAKDTIHEIGGLALYFLTGTGL
jgi:uncharacterized SAM-binding protein YcdF (DUF218 family)